MKTSGFNARLLVSALTLAFTAAIAADTESEPTYINPANIKWEDAPPSLPKGAKVAVLRGDPGKSGPFVIRLKTPAGYKVAPHWHTQAENLTVLSGTLYLGSGDKVDTSHAHALSAGAFHYLPGKAHHYAYTKVPTIVQVHGEGPLDLNYINPADDPQKASKQ